MAERLKRGGATIEERYMEADEFFNIYDETERNRRLREYIDGRIDYKMEDYFRALFAAKEKAEKAGRRCAVCGVPIIRKGKGAAKYCEQHQAGGKAAKAALASWGFIVERYYPLAEKIMEMMKAEGRWPE